MPPTPFLQLAVALGLGLLVGLQRERTDSAIAGIRTFALITLLGTVAALLGKVFGGWVVAVGFLASAVLVVSGNVVRMQSKEADPGQTTEFTALLMYGIGALVVIGPMTVAVVLGGAVAVLLNLREPLHRFVGKMEEGDLRAIMQLALIALVILPVLPDRPMGPYDVLNPYQIWWMVVLIVGLSLAGYIGYKMFGAHGGAVVGGLLGGLISSTATTASYARRTREEPDSSRLAALVVVLAASVVFGRILVEVGAVAPRSFRALAPPIGAMLGVGALISVGIWIRSRQKQSEPPGQTNPADLKSALLFGAIYAAVLLAVAFARDRFGTAGLYTVAGLSGLTDMDAITLSTARLVEGGGLPPSIAWRAILIAAMSNLVFKAGIVAVLGSRQLLWRVAALFGMLIAAAVAIFWLWP